MALKLSHSQRELYALCPRKYYYRYERKLRSKAKGSALPFGTAFDNATECLFKGGTLDEAKQVFTNFWMPVEANYHVKFGASDYDQRILTQEDIVRLESCLSNLPPSKELSNYNGDIVALIKDYIKTKDNSYVRNLKDLEVKFLHYATTLSMHRKGHLMLESFYANIYSKITRVIDTQRKITLKHPDGHEVTGLIDLMCGMEGYELNNGRKLTADDVVIADVKSSSRAGWENYDDLTSSTQLDTYLIAVQSEHPTNLIGYFVTSKQVSANSESYCVKCNAKKESTHRTCNANDAAGKRCGGEWKESVTYYCDSKIVIGERNVEEAKLMLRDFDDTLAGIQYKVFPRNRNSCEAFNSICEYKNTLCGKCFNAPAEEIQAEDNWKKEYGE